MNKKKEIAPEIAKAEQTQALNDVKTAILSLEPGINQMIGKMIEKMPDSVIIQRFNQAAQDFFALLTRFITKTGNPDAYNLRGYVNLFNHAIENRPDWPIDKFTLMILKFAPQVYNEDDDFFVNIEVPETQVKVTNEFGIIRTEMFKQLWLKAPESDRKLVRASCKLLTTYAHAYFASKVDKAAKKK